MLLNMYSSIFPIYGTKVLLIFDIAKFICFFSQKSLFACIYQKNVVTLCPYFVNSASRCA